MGKLSRRRVVDRLGKGLELVSKEKFELQRDGVRDGLRDKDSSCDDCQKERVGKHSGTPIVVRLRDMVSKSQSSTPLKCLVGEHGNNDKNFNALLSAIERVHLKDASALSTAYDNLAENVFSYKARTHCELLNNAAIQQSEKESGLLTDNIIHNDLSGSRTGSLHRQGSDASTNDGEFESSSCSSIISEVSTESDIDTSSAADDLSRDELNRLTEHTTGYSLTRCAGPVGSHCPDCVANVHRQHAAGQFIFPLVNANHCTRQQRRQRSRRTNNCSVVVSTGRGRVEVSVANLMHNDRSKSYMASTVSIDLTDTDFTYDVFYANYTHANVADYRAPAYSSIASVLYPAYWGGANGGYAYPQLGYWVQPMHSIPAALCVPRHLKCLTSECLSMVPAHHAHTFTASQPPHRPWLPLAHCDGRKPMAVYSVMCYNVLCDKYATRQLYGYCPSWALNWDYRKKSILDEIRQYSADIISLQEVETEQFYNFFLPELKRDGYGGIFSPKSRARTMVEAERKHVDGCAIFYRTSKFSLVKEHLVEFNQLAMASAEGSHDMINRVMTKDNIGLAAVLETRDAVWENGMPPNGQSQQLLLVATCHVHWDPEFCDVKLIQTMILMSELKNIIEETSASLRPGSTHPTSNSFPLLLCGDLNSLPDSGVVEFLNSGKVAANHDDFKDLGYEDCLRKLSNSDNKEIFTHVFNLAQAYAKDMMPYTNYTFDFKGIIDYIFYSRDFMRPLGVLGPLDQEWYRHNKVLGCPHPHIPSDHLPLLVEFEMMTSAEAVGRTGVRR